MTRTLTESALMAALSFVLYVSGYVPFVSAFALLASPLPITWIGTRHGGRQASMAALCTSVVVGLVLGPPDAYLYLVPFGLLGVLCGALFYRDEEPSRIVVIGTLLLFLATTPAGMFLEKAMGLEDPIAELKKIAESALVTPLEWTYGADRAGCAQASQWMKGQITTVVKFPLAFFLFTCLVLFYANYMASFLLFLRLKVVVPPPPDLRRFRPPLAIAIALPVSIAAYSWAGGGNGQLLNSVLLNGVLIVVLFLFLGGISCLTVLMDAWKIRPLARVAISFVTMFVLWPLVIVLGAADSLAGIRDLPHKVEERSLETFR